MSNKQRWLVLASLSILLRPAIAAAQETLWRTYIEAGSKANGTHDRAAAVRLYSLAILEARRFHPGDTRLAYSLVCLADCYYVGIYLDSLVTRAPAMKPCEDALAKAEPLYREALSILERTRGSDDPSIACYSGDLAEVCFLRGEYPDAECYYRRELTVHEKRLGPDSPQVMGVLRHLARVYTKEAKYVEAEALARRVLTFEEKQADAIPLSLADTLDILAEACTAQGKTVEAKQFSQRAQIAHQKATRELNKLPMP